MSRALLTHLRAFAGRLLPLGLRALVLAAAAMLVDPRAVAAEPFDILIVNGEVYDGTGAGPEDRNIGIREGRIVSVDAAADAAARLVIDAAGLAVAPGFIDAHSHVPESIANAEAPFLTPQLITQGVTTVVMGPDGFLAPARLREIIALLQEKRSATNFACYVGHNGVRGEVMGSAQRAPTHDDLERMKELVREGMRMGCVGLSAGLMYEPGMFSGPDEIIALAREVRPFGGTFDSHSRHPVMEFLSAETETIDIGAAAGIPAKLAHLKAVGLMNRGRSGEIIAAVEAARAQGREVVADMYPYDGAATNLLRNILVFPDSDPLRGASAPLGDVQRRLRGILGDTEARAALQSDTESGRDGGFSWVRAVGYGSMRIVDAPSSPELVGENIELLAAEREQQPFDLIAELILEDAEDITITLGAIEEADVRNLMRQPWMMIASDGSYVGPGSAYPNTPHPRSTGTFTRVLGHYVRETGLLSLEEAVRRMTWLPAEHLNLRDRGRIAAGYAADIAIFDPETVSDRSTYIEPLALSVGVQHVIVGGELVLHNGDLTGAAPGRFVPRQPRSITDP